MHKADTDSLNSSAVKTTGPGAKPSGHDGLAPVLSFLQPRAGSGLTAPFPGQM